MQLQQLAAKRHPILIPTSQHPHCTIPPYLAPHQGQQPVAKRHAHHCRRHQAGRAQCRLHAECNSKPAWVAGSTKAQGRSGSVVRHTRLLRCCPQHSCTIAPAPHVPATLPALPQQPTCCSVSCCIASSSGTPVALNQEVTAAPATVEELAAAAALAACTCTAPRCRAGCCRAGGCAVRAGLRLSCSHRAAARQGAAAAAAPGRRHPGAATKALAALADRTPDIMSGSRCGFRSACGPKTRRRRLATGA